MTLEKNKILAKLFREMSSMYLYLGDERFRALAYSKAAKIIDSLTEDITLYCQHHSPDDLPGIGEGIAGKIDEFIRSGKIKKYESLKKTVPFELLELTEIRGFGPQSIKRIHEQLHISTKEKLIEALQNGRISNMKGFGKKKVENMLRGLKIHKTIEERMLLWDALELAEGIKKRLSNIDGVKQVEIAGSLRRKKETIGDIDMLVACDEKHRKKISSAFCASAYVKQILAKGETKTSVILTNSAKQMDLRLVKEEEWGSALQYFTGSKEHNIHLRSIAKEKGYKISEYGIFRISDNKRIAGFTEEDIYNTLGLQIMPPEMREDKGEIELAAQHKIPELVCRKDIKGDLQMHSNWSDGTNSIEEIADYLKNKLGFEYMVLTDHSKSSRIANGLDEKKVLKQIKAIDQINKKMGGHFVKKGIEVDILLDGTLDLSDEVLSQLDWVTASIHSSFNKDNTERLVKACQHPYVNCIGHPSGRLLGSREAYKLDIHTVFENALKSHTALEINSQPYRMDLNEEHTSIARQLGIQLVISTDSHSLNSFKYLDLGVSIARRAWCSAADILNTKTWEEIEEFKKNKRVKMSHQSASHMLKS